MKQLFITKLLYWCIVLYFTTIACAAIAIAMQYTIAIFHHAALFSILSILIFFLFGMAFTLSFCNMLCFIVLKTNFRHVLYAIVWASVFILTGGVFLFSLVQAVLAQEYA